MSLFDRVCDLSPSERERELNEACSDNPELRRHVEALLRADVSQDLLITEVDSSRNLAGLATEMIQEFADADALPERIGNYQVVRKIGAGGMGVIYEAQQESPRRGVAIKVLKPGMISRELMKRFQHEAEVLGQLQHTGIAQIFEAGLSDTPLGKQPFFVMELIDGEALDKYANKRRCVSLYTQILTSRSDTFSLSPPTVI